MRQLRAAASRAYARCSTAATRTPHLIPTLTLTLTLALALALTLTLALALAFTLALSLALTLALSVGQENRYRCEKCRQLVRARKQLTLHTPPRHLTVQVTLPLAMLT